MNALQQTATKRRRIDWTNEEVSIVSNRYHAFLRAGYLKGHAMVLAQSVMPEHRRRDEQSVLKTSPALLADALLTSAADMMFWDDAIAAEKAEHPAYKRRSVEPTPAEPVVEAPPVSREPVLGPLELALQGMVGNAVNAQVGQIVEELRRENRELRDTMQSLLTQQFDAMMCYWDPAYKARMEATPEYVGVGELPPLLSEVRVRVRRVLVVGNRDVGIQQLRLQFKNVDFEFLESTDVKGGGGRGFYDVVVCNRFVDHESWGKLRALHGNKFHRIEGGLTTIIATVKKALDL